MSVEPNQPKKAEKKSVENGLSLGQAFGLAWEMGYLLAIPLVALALGGRLLDKHFGTSPLFILLGIGLSIVISSILLAKKATKIISDLSSDKDTEHKP